MSATQPLERKGTEMEEVLYLVHRMPFPPNKGDKVRSYHLLRYLAGRYRVHLGTFVDDESDWTHTAAVKSLCVDAHFASLDRRRAKLLSVRGLFRKEPLTLPFYRDAGLQAWVDKVLDERPIRQIVVFSGAMAQYVVDARGPGLIVDFVDVDSAKWSQFARSYFWPMSWVYRREGERLLAYEREVAELADASIFVTPNEAKLFRRLAPESAEKVFHVLNGVDAAYFSPEHEFPSPYATGEQAIVFTGAMDYWPNADAASWFAREVLPRVRAHSADVRFYVVGARPLRQVTALRAIPGVVVTGEVPDVRPYIAHARLAVAPMRLARGVQNKALEAMAMAKPVVISRESAVNLVATPGVELEVASGREEFTRKVLRMLASQRAHAIGLAARERVLRDYNWNENLSRIEQHFRLPADTIQSVIRLSKSTAS